LLFQEKVTSRIVVGSREIVPLLHARRLALEDLDPPHAIEAFKSYADLRDGDDNQIDTICDLVGYHPHAIKLVGPVTYVKSLSLTELAELLERKRWELVQQGEIDYRFNMRLSFEFSYENLESSNEGFV